MMKIAIEAQRIFRENKHGMDFVALETIRQIQKLDKENQYFIFVGGGEDRCLEESENMRIIQLDTPTYPLWEQYALPRAVKQVGADILHCTSNTAPVVCDVPLVLTLHDIIFMEPRNGKNRSTYQNLGWYYRRIVVPKILPKCKKIVTVSGFERDRIRQALGLPDDSIVAIHNGYGSHFKQGNEYLSVTKKYTPADRYIFFLGNTDPKKNSDRTLLAYALYARKVSSPLPLLVADLKQEEIDRIAKEQNIEDVRWLIHCAGYIPNGDLPYIYNGASLFLYTSLRESFGIPLLEAMACGVPVITSNTSAIPEVAGEGAIMVDPLDPQQIANQIIRLETDSDYRHSTVEYGLERVKNFSWEKCAKELLKLYNSLK